MNAFDHLDGWFEKGFRVRQQKAAKGARATRRDAVRSRAGGPGPARRGSVKFSADAKAKNIKSVIRKAPEVMVKITGSSSGLRTVKHHLDYISRNGEVELVDEHGQSIHGKAQVRGLLEQLKASQIPDSGNKREFLHIIFSMPAGTSDKAMREAVANFCQEEFSNRRYAMAQHDDTDHSHIHVCVGTRDIDRADEPRLSPRKADLFRWRQGFADKLRELGVDAAASERRHRFNHRKSEHAVVRQIRADNPASAAFNSRRAEAKAAERAMKASARPQKSFVGPLRPARVPKVIQGLQSELKAALAAGVRPANPAHEQIEKNRTQVLAGWEKAATALANAGERELANQLRHFMQPGQAAPRSRNQVLFDVAMSRPCQDAGRHNSDDLAR